MTSKLLLLPAVAFLCTVPTASAHPNDSNSKTSSPSVFLTAQESFTAYQSSPVEGHWSSVAYNRDYEYNFASDGTYEFSKATMFGSARIQITGRGTYQVSDNAVYCHQTAVDSSGSPGRTVDETWSFNGRALSMNGLTMTR
jgi:2',3'-cyclic-nucleotide 2'-phosphodiesterase (5'-nucleotidase family)